MLKKEEITKTTIHLYRNPDENCSPAKVNT